MEHIYFLLPRFALWSKCFPDWTDADWHDPENLSALWDLFGHLTGTGGQVLWIRSTHDVYEIPQIGLLTPESLEANKAWSNTPSVTSTEACESSP